jgi:hypothetical protein
VELRRTLVRRTSENTPSPSVGIELARRHGTGVVNRTVREHEDGPTPPPRSARPPRSRIVSGGPGPVHAPFGPFRPARERRGARKSPAAQEGEVRAAGPDGILLPGSEGDARRLPQRTSENSVKAKFRDHLFQVLGRIRNKEGPQPRVQAPGAKRRLGAHEPLKTIRLSLLGMSGAPL